MRINVPASANVDVSDRAARVLGQVSGAAGMNTLIGVKREEVNYRTINSQSFRATSRNGLQAAVYPTSSVFHKSADTGSVLIVSIQVGNTSAAGEVNLNVSQSDLQISTVTIAKNNPNGAASNCVARGGNHSVGQGSTYGIHTTPLKTMVECCPKGGILLPAGWKLTVQDAAFNEVLDSIVEWFEFTGTS